MDVDPTADPDPAAAALRAGFSQALVDTAASAVKAGATDGGATAVTTAYHGELLLQFCSLAARTFFQKTVGAGA